MPVQGPLAIVLEVASLQEGIKFYTDAGLEVASDGAVARFHCPGQERDCIILVGGARRKRLHHIVLRADKLEDVAARTPAAGGIVEEPPNGFDVNGLWVRDPHGMLIHLIECSNDTETGANATL